MAIVLYNTLNRKKEEFKPINPSKVGIYSCGPTVYWNQHIGNMYAYIQWDAFVRFLKYAGYTVNWVMNITDVGHLTSDEDTGEDKLEKGAKRENSTVWQIADKYIKQFMDSVDALNIIHPNVLCRATDHIQDQIELIKKIEQNGYAYKISSGLVFDTSKFADYAKFAKLKLSKQEAGNRIEEDKEKKSPWDFMLWVTNQPNHVMQWDSPWGRGFPGWHIECTAMSTKYLGDTFDIHTGGIEHIPVHHTNEIAQGFGAFGRTTTANYWMHNAWLKMSEKKISKSLGNVYLVDDLVEKGYNPISFRYLVFNSHYRTGQNFTWEALDSAQTALNKLYDFVSQVQSSKPSSTGDSNVDEWEEKFVSALSNDLNLPSALAIVWDLVKDPSLGHKQKVDLLLKWDTVLGFKLANAAKSAKVLDVPSEVKELGLRREQYRNKKKFTEADNVRKQINELGYDITDTPEGPDYRPI